MTIELDKTARAAAIASIERYHLDDSGERIGNVAAAALLHFFLTEIAPSVYNRAVAEVQERLLARVGEVDVECHEEEFGYWAAQAKATRRR